MHVFSAHSNILLPVNSVHIDSIDTLYIDSLQSSKGSPLVLYYLRLGPDLKNAR